MEDCLYGMYKRARRLLHRFPVMEKLYRNNVLRRIEEEELDSLMTTELVLEKEKFI